MAFIDLFRFKIELFEKEWVLAPRTLFLGAFNFLAQKISFKAADLMVISL